jgi:xylan 1,4-beta-xylosidase
VWGGNRGTADLSWLNFRNTHYAAGFVCKLVDQYCRRVQDDWGTNLGIVDIDNCQLQWEKSLFSGQRSQLTPLFRYPSTDLIRKPLFNAYVLLSRLGDERLESSCREPDFGRKYGCLATRRGRSLSVMIWNFEDGLEDEVNPRRFILRIRGYASSGSYRLIHFRIDSRHSTAYRVWSELGKPAEPEREQIRAIREKENLELAAPVAKIEVTDPLSIPLELPMHGVSLLLLVPENRKPPQTPSWIKGEQEFDCRRNPQVFLKWMPNSEVDFLHYRLWRKNTEADEEFILCKSCSLNTSLYTDSQVLAGNTYRYRIEAVNANGVSSGYSEELVVSVS